ncbi:MFS transporter [Paenibacillus apiarius]|uniref:MFS transporter n=1 Tax=Paenibacillus apiarius TaxID=46240 RepID=A0ABT4DUG1_9BACL|nr:MFS transporter [Paenibacillus apiarius]MCY9514515.1 MFS transporter [Paenibacillus apiarius]MCY9520946.1 MFS transporter [Paenibacillus apiarius]MCY9551794.1 MFS transporter [Paenibacillus apiarius]MCY9557681.1 MFS transporter [Paenibacillus apiarius]MCY9684368.1 MFS transporter [Paenibacillus apiarius]
MGIHVTPVRKAAFTSGNLASNLMAQMFSAYIVYYYVDVLGVRPGLIGIAMVIHGIFGAILNPLFGYVSDRFRTRWGRRVPYISFGMIPLAAVFTLLWFPLSSGTGLFWYFLFIVLLYDVLYVLVILNYSALFPEMFATMKERASASSWKQMFGIIGMIAGVAGPPLFYDRYGWETMGLMFGIAAALFMGVMVWGSRENEQAAPDTFGLWKAVRYTCSNRFFIIYVLGGFFVQLTFALLPAAIPFFTKYALHAEESANSILLGLVFVTAIPCVYAWARWTNRFGPRKTMLAAIACYAAALAPLLFVATPVAAYVTGAAIGFGLAGIIMLLEVLLAEVIDEDERRTGARREGIYFGMNGFTIRFGVSLQAVIMSLVLEQSGYAANAAAQPDAAIAGIRFMLAGIPILSLALAFICFYCYRLGIARPPKGHSRG